MKIKTDKIYINSPVEFCVLCGTLLSLPPYTFRIVRRGDIFIVPIYGCAKCHAMNSAHFGVN